MTAKDKVNILLVDDQPAKLLSYEAILGRLGENLVRANSAQEALAHLLKQDFAVVLMDVCMPEMDGFELASLIREHPRCQKTPIILVSAVHMTDPDRLKGYDAGAVDYVSVPVIPEILRAKVGVFAELYRKSRQLEELNRDLELRVAQRTAELAASNARLRESEQRLKMLNETLEQRVAQRTVDLRRQANLLDQTNDAVFAWELGGRIVYWNKAAEQMYGHTADEVVGRMTDAVLAREFPIERTELETALERDGAWAGELSQTHRNGRRFVADCRMRIVRDDHGALVLTANRDITLRKDLEREVLEIADQEQQRIGQDLHDTVGQELTGLALLAGSLVESLGENAQVATRPLSRRGDFGDGAIPPDMKLADKIASGLRRLLGQVRALSRGLIPMEIVPEGLASALDDLSLRIAEQTGVRCTFHCDATILLEDTVLASHLFRIAQEAITNAITHGRAQRISIRLTGDQDQLRLVVEDDGAGIQPRAARSSGTGLRTMHYRADLIGAVLQVQPLARGGTLVTCVLNQIEPSL